MPAPGAMAHTRAMAKRATRDGVMLGAAVLTWAAVGLPYWSLGWSRAFGGGPEDARQALAIWAVAHGTFLLALLAGYLLGRSGAPRWACLLLLALQTVSALVAAAAFGDSLQGALLVIVATQTAMLLGMRGALAWIAIQSVALGIALGREEGRLALAVTAAFVGFQLFALLAVTMAEREAAARLDLARSNAELEAARELLAESSRVAERLRISRELHDGLGHHLTALSLQLEVAAHAGNGKADEAVARAREVVGRALDDLRYTVRALREEPPVDLVASLRRLAAGIPRPRIHLAIPARLAVEDPVRANAVLRAAQELATNAVRHSGADHLWLEIETSDGWLELSARDDGDGAARFAPGSGLGGMRERIEGLGGEVEVDPAPGTGFRSRLRIPLAQRAVRTGPEATE